MTDVIRLHPIDQQQTAIWRLAKEVASAFDALPFVLIGGLMVQLLEAERGVVSGFATGDVDVVIDVRALTGATQRAAAALVDAGFEPEQYDDDLTYRFVRGDDVVDLLAPDHLGVRTSIVTVPPASTLPALGSRQALNRLRTVLVDTGDGAFDLPVPSLTGAIVIKARVVESAAGRASLPKHERDLDSIGPCQAREPQSGSQSTPLRQTPQTRLRALDMQWPRAFILLLPAWRLRS